MLLNVQGVGRLSSDIELIYGANGNAIAKFSFVSSEKFTAKDGQKKENVCFVECAAFSRLAEICNQYCKKGSQVYISGRLKLDQWTDQSGAKRSKHSITVEELVMLDGKSENSAPQPKQAPKVEVVYGKQENKLLTNEFEIDSSEIPF